MRAILICVLLLCSAPAFGAELAPVVMKRIEKLGKTADRSGVGGYRADLPKSGTYTCVMYVKKNKMLFGKVITATVQGYK